MCQSSTQGRSLFNRNDMTAGGDLTCLGDWFIVSFIVLSVWSPHVPPIQVACFWAVNLFSEWKLVQCIYDRGHPIFCQVWEGFWLAARLSGRQRRVRSPLSPPLWLMLKELDSCDWLQTAIVRKKLELLVGHYSSPYAVKTHVKCSFPAFQWYHTCVVGTFRGSVVNAVTPPRCAALIRQENP